MRFGEVWHGAGAASRVLRASGCGRSGIRKDGPLCFWLSFPLRQIRLLASEFKARSIINWIEVLRFATWLLQSLSVGRMNQVNTVFYWGRFSYPSFMQGVCASLPVASLPSIYTTALRGRLR